MKVLMLCKSLTLGGVETHLLTLCQGLKDQGHQVWLVSRKLGKEIKNLLEAMDVPWSEKNSPGEVSELIKREGIEIVHLHPWEKTLAMEKIYQVTKVPFVVTCHGLTKEAVLPLSETASKFICVSEAVRRFMLSINFLPARCVVIHNPIDLKKFRPHLTEEEPGLIVFAARLSVDKYKAANQLVSAVAKINKAQLWILGDGNKKRKISHGERVSFLGATYHPEEIMARASIICGESRVVMEAMAMGKAALVLGNNGYLGPIGKKNFEDLEKDNFMCLKKVAINSDKLRKDLAHLLKHPGERLILGEYNRVLAANKYDAKKITQAIVNEYQKALIQKEISF